MLPGIPGVSKEAVKYVQERLLLDLSEEEAAARFSQLIHESISSSLSTQVRPVVIIDLAHPFRLCLN